ncbi:DUF4261 domain-containing protein [Desulfoluna sp.]|uniref:DUF4261 domain-containing protein n=1 Tax=Desulfoluna sp. TaxID=2045199 RepID=UPI00260D5080|nr:DUF4261 domain-containing protein [Desulfoluna sp.]
MSDTNDEDGFARTYGVELLFEAEPKIDVSAAVAELEERIGAIDHKESGDQNMFFLMDHQVTYEGEKQVPSQLILVHADPKKDKDSLYEVVQQSWRTPNASEIVSRTKYKVLLTDIMASGLEPKERHFILSNAISVFIKFSNSIGVANKRTQQIIDSSEIISSSDPLLGFINIRFFNAGDQGLLMDSLGLAALGFYDIQCHFVDLDPNEVSSQLYNIAYYIFNEEPEFDNGHTVAGVNGQNWSVQYENSLVAPHRNILDLNPGTEYAVGNR